MKNIQKNDSKQIRWGIVLSYTEQFISILSGLIYTPIMLKILGQAEYGLYQLSYSVISFLGLLNFGFASGYLRLYYRYRKNNSKRDIDNLNGMYLIIFSVVSVIAGIFGIIMVNSAKLIFADGLNNQELEKIKILMLIMIFNLIITFMTSVFDCYLSAYNRFIFQRGILVIRGILNPFISLPLLILGYGSIAMTLVSLALAVFGLFSSIFYCVTKLHMHFQFDHINQDVFKELFKFTFYIFLSSIVDKINLSLDNFLLGRMTGTMIVAVYGVGAQINIFFNKISTSIASIFAPQINNIIAQKENSEKIQEMFINVSKPLFFILFFVWFGFLFYGKWFINIWAGENYSESYYVALILMFGCIIPLTQVCGIEIQKARNMHQARSIVYFLIALGNIAISIPLIKAWGAIGASLGTLLTMLLGNGFFMNWYYHKKMNLDMFFYWRQIVAVLKIFIIPNIIGTIYLVFSKHGTTETIVSGIIYVASIALELIYSCKKNKKIFNITIKGRKYEQK